MYISPDEERSDLFLAAAAYIVGRQILLVLLDGLRVPALVLPGVQLVVALLTTIVVPVLLIRYRKQRLSEFGFDSTYGAAGLGFVASLPLVVAYLVSSLVAGTSPVDVLPATVAVVHGAYLEVVVQVIANVCAVLLAIYTTVKARTGFRADPTYIRPTMLYLGRFAALAAAIASGLLFVTIILRPEYELRTAVEVLVVPLGVAGSAYLAWRTIRESQLTSRATLLTPMVLLAVGSIALFGDGTTVVFGLWRGAILAGIGLIVGTLLESRRTVWAPLGFAAGMTLLTPLPL